MTKRTRRKFTMNIKYKCLSFKAVIQTAGAGAVASTLISSLALGSAAWAIVNFATK